MLNRGVEGIESELFVKFLVGENYCELSQTQMIIEILAFFVILSRVKHVTMTSSRPVSMVTLDETTQLFNLGGRMS
jgi:hypothetical protein